MASRRICVLTTGRQDYGILRSTLLALHASAEFELLLLVGGMHLRERFGRTVEMVRADGLPVARELDFVAEPPDPTGDAARAVAAVGSALDEMRPDCLLLIGDRHETAAAALAATLQVVPIAHLHGGEETEGAVDNALRHSITKLSHLHLVSHPLHARRVVQMGEDPKCVVVVGAPGLDNLLRKDLPGVSELETRLGIALRDPVVVVTVHPTTLGDDPLAELRAVAGAMEEVDATYVVTQPNADQGGDQIRRFWAEWLPDRRGVAVVDALGERNYWGLLRRASAVLGNSSSGIIEAPVLGLPVIDVGERQRGRLASGPVMRVAAERSAVVASLAQAVGRAARAHPSCCRAETPAPPVAPRLLAALAAWHPQRPPRKSFRQIQ